MTDITTSHVIRFLHSVFVHEGFPNHILTDYGVQFTSPSVELNTPFLHRTILKLMDW